MARNGFRFAHAGLLLVAAYVVPGCQNYLEPVDSKVLATLPPQEAKELRVWNANHPEVYDLRIHTLYTCPFLNYTPAYLALSHDPSAWADYLYTYKKHVHDEVGHCNCASTIARSKTRQPSHEAIGAAGGSLGIP